MELSCCLSSCGGRLNQLKNNTAGLWPPPNLGRLSVGRSHAYWPIIALEVNQNRGEGLIQAERLASARAPTRFSLSFAVALIASDTTQAAAAMAMEMAFAAQLK